jgi:hypothetical protein
MTSICRYFFNLMKKQWVGKTDGLGDICFMNFEDIDLKLRRINMPDMSSYVIKQIEDEVRSFIKGPQLDCVEKHLAVIGNKNAYYLVMQANPTLFTMTETIRKLKDKPIYEKLPLLLIISKAMAKIVVDGSTSHHGHFHPDNVLVE